MGSGTLQNCCQKTKLIAVSTNTGYHSQEPPTTETLQTSPGLRSSDDGPT